MAVHVQCPACKKQVPFGRLFCTFCGEKLELTPDKVTSRLTVTEAYGAVRKVVIRLISLSVVAGIVGVFLWPMEPVGQVGSAAHATSCQSKIASTRARALNGLVFMEQFSEQEVNALLAERLTKTANTEAGAGFQLTGVNVVFTPGKVMVNTRLQAWKAVVSYEVELAPKIGSKGFEHEVTGLRIGHVPVPAQVAGFLAGRALNVFSEFTAEAETLGRMKQLVVEKGLVRVSTQQK